MIYGVNARTIRITEVSDGIDYAPADNYASASNITADSILGNALDEIDVFSHSQNELAALRLSSCEDGDEFRVSFGARRS